MRALRKPWPPADVSPDGQAPRNWRQAEEQFLDGLANTTDQAEYARTTFDGRGEIAIEKRKFREVMYQEQGALCVYCERRVGEGHPTPRIDHWQPLSAEPRLAMHWHNLYLSCPTKETCDQRKTEQRFRSTPDEPDLPWPVNHAYERCIGFTSLGEVYVRSDAPLNDAQRRALVLALGVPHDDELRDNGVLNLNHPTLVAARMAALDSERTSLEREHPDRTATREDREARKSALLGEQPLKEFVSIRARWLERSLGKAR